MAQEFDLAPGGAELWQVDGTYFLVYAVPTTDPPIYMHWQVRDDEALKAHVPTGAEAKPDRTLTREQFRKTGAIPFGYSDELRNFNDHPFSEFEESFEQEANVQPWLRDEEVLAVVTAAMLEGRAPTTAELSATEYFQNRSAAEVDWLVDLATDPTAARARREDSRAAVREMLVQSGVKNPPDALVNLLGDRWVEGKWTEAFVAAQVRGVADPASGVKLREEVATAARGFDPRSADDSAVASGRDAVRDRVRQMFVNRGVDIATENETEAERLERITDEVMNGRSMQDVRRSINRIAGVNPDAETDITRAGESEVQALATRWLGPVAGKMDQFQLREWAGRFRNDPDAQTEFVERLQAQRLALLPHYENENLTYEDIVSPVRNMAANIWGQPVQDETLLVDLANTGDYTEMAKRLRTEGRKRGVGKVIDDSLADLGSTAMGQQVVRSSI